MIEIVALAASKAPLGTPVRLTATLPETRREKRLNERGSLQKAAGYLMPQYGVAQCGVGLIPGTAGVAVYRTAEGTAHYGNLKTCGSVWVCPVCAAKISERRRGEIQTAIQAHCAQHGEGTILIAAYTASHKRTDGLSDVLTRFLKAQERMKGNRPYKRLKARYGLVGSIKSLEVTWGEPNGWHPHCHTLLFFDKPVDAEAFRRELYGAWEGAARAQGLSMTEARGLVIQSAWGEVQDYVAKWGHEPTEPVWDATAELTKGHSKRARGDEAGPRYTPFDLLRWFRDTGEVRPARLFREFATAFKGRHQLNWSDGLRARVGLGVEESDETVATKLETPAVLLGLIDRERWAAVCYYEQRGQVLIAAERGGWDAVVAVLDHLLEQYRAEARGPT